MKTEHFDAFFSAYLTTALWSSVISELEDERDGDPFDRHFSESDFDAGHLETLRAHALSFYLRALVWIEAEAEPKCGPDFDRYEHAGHDFWLTQNGHGAGFWDGDWPTYGDTLTKLAKCYPETHLFILSDDDGNETVIAE